MFSEIIVNTTFRKNWINYEQEFANWNKRFSNCNRNQRILEIVFFLKNERLNYVFKQNCRFQFLNNSLNQNLRRKSKNYFSRINEHHSIEKFMISRDRVLRFQNIMMFDFDKHFVKFFIRRFQQIIVIENSRIVLRVFFICLKKNALK